MTGRHTLTFRGENGAIPAGFGLCTKCGALLQIEQWLEETCLGVNLEPWVKEEEAR